MTPNELRDRYSSCAHFPPAIMYRLIDLWEAAQKLAEYHHDFCSTELVGETECDCGYAGVKDALKALEEA